MVMGRLRLFVLLRWLSIEEVAAKYGIEEGEARTFVGVALRLNREAFLACVQVPMLALAKPAE